MEEKMTLMEAIQARHAVRSYEDKPIPSDIVEELSREVEACNTEGSLHMQLVTNEPQAFKKGLMVHTTNIKGVQNYLAIVANSKPDREEDTGYYGERIVLKAQMLGLNSCWVAMSVSKSTVKKNVEIGPDEKLYIVIALGYGTTQGKQHKSKTPDQVIVGSKDAPAWFADGVKAALLAPTAINQQKFTFEYKDGKVYAKAGSGPYSKTDLGIVKYHFEVASGQTDIFA